MFDYFRLVMAGPSAPQGVTEIAELLEEQARQACADCGLGKAEIYCGGGLVTLFLTERDAWEAVIVGADAYQLYPGFVSADGCQITWPNIWVADNYNLNTFTTALKGAIERAARSDH
ncbi:MAG: hypothetical protein ABL956_02545 [Hyphomonadaceae bacterium]